MQLENELWDFALDFYRLEGVESACLDLQQQDGLSINRLIFAIWSGLNGIRLSELHFSSAAETWQSEITHPLRAIRYKVRENKSEVSECYQKLRAAELACEQVELALLHLQVSDSAQKKQKGSVLVEENLQTYLKSVNLPIDTELSTNITLLISVVEKQYLLSM